MGFEYRADFSVPDLIDLRLAAKLPHLIARINLEMQHLSRDEVSDPAAALMKIKKIINLPSSILLSYTPGISQAEWKKIVDGAKEQMPWLQAIMDLNAKLDGTDWESFQAVIVELKAENTASEYHENLDLIVSAFQYLAGAEV